MFPRITVAALLIWLVPLVGPPALHAADDKAADAGKSIIAVFRLTGPISEVAEDETFSFGAPTGVTLRDLVDRLKKAGNDRSVKAVVLLCEGASIGNAQVEEVRQAMAKLRTAGKEIHVHSDSLTMRGYILLSGATRLSMAPTADLWVTGLYGEAPYLRGLLDKIGARPDFLTCGEFKSAAEIFMREGPSPAAEKMQNWLLDGLYDTYVALIAKGRGVDAAKVKGWIDSGPYAAEKAKAAGLIDAVEPRQEFEALLKTKFGKNVAFDKKYGKKKTPELDFSSPLAIFKLWAELLADSQKKSGKNAVAIVHVDGAITLGSSQASPFGGSGAKSSDIRKALDEAARDESIKAVVLRVNSPGGSAVASEIILDATKRVKAKKPFVVSMGDVAGSGGYYVACGAEVIFADQATITGSIGVVAGKIVTTQMWKNIGINFKSYKRGSNAGLLSSEQVFSDSERARLQAWMDDIYTVFKDHVVAIRGKRLKKPIDELAGGRVYTGQQALELGLVDKIGTLQDAIQHAAAEAKLTDYDVRVIPAPKNFLERLIEESSGGKDDTKNLALGRHVSLVELAMPYLQNLDPERVRLIQAALQRLQLVQQETVILMMPEMMLAR